MSAPVRLLKRLVRSQKRTPKVQGVTGLPRMSTERMTEVMHPFSVTCIYPYIAGVRKCRLCMCPSHTLVEWLVYSSDRTPTVQGATGLPRVCTEPMAQDVYIAYG